VTREALLEALRREVADVRVLRAMAEVDREAFVPEGERARAWEDCALPIGAGQTISQPSLVARMCAHLALRGDEVVLDVGTGSGYHAAVLARIARHVVSVERHAALSARARQALGAAGIANVTLVTGDGSRGHPERAPYDAINVAAASAAGVPPALTEQLAGGGRLLVPVTDGDEERLVLVRRRGGRLHEERLDHVRFVPLVVGA
jgi:protein-L-isoaspartate(D-aspartate) O-methyltransferase